jgi:hypothetical protein
MTAILERYPTAAAAHTDGWNRQAENDADPTWLATGCIHHEDGCQGGRGTPARTGWHVIESTVEDVAQATWLCDHCLRTLEARASRRPEPVEVHWTQKPALRVQDATAARISREARLARQRDRRAAWRAGDPGVPRPRA